MYLRIAGRMVYLWRAVDAEGEVLDVLIQSKRNKPAALKLMRKLLKKYGFVPNGLTTDKLPSYAGAIRKLGMESRHDTDRWANNRAENSHQPTRRRERKMQRFNGRPRRSAATPAGRYRIIRLGCRSEITLNPGRTIRQKLRVGGACFRLTKPVHAIILWL
jgi:transposase-like protein